MLQARGLPAGECPEAWNVSHPEVVREIAAAYAAAGADMVLTNTFGGSPIKLARFGLREKTAPINRAGVRLSREGAPGRVVAASVGPCGELLAPLGTLSEEEAEAGFAEQIAALLEGGVRVIVIETMTSLEEALCALRAAKKLDPQVEAAVTLTFDPTPSGFHTIMGVDIPRAVAELSRAGADVLGSNCGNGIDQMIPIAREFRRLSDRPILIQANAGQPELVGGQTVFRESPRYMASRVRELVEAGADIVGGCCGTNPRHISACRREVDRLRAARS
jgi:5-methyltetrahydrofolate--homocysteine methyltransferase